MPKRGRESPEWVYESGALSGPEPVPPVPPITSIHGGELGASAEHDVAEVDQELRVVVLGTGFVPHPWHEDRVEHPFYLSGWSKNLGWYARYRRRGRKFYLTHVWADSWAATTYGESAFAARRPRGSDGDAGREAPPAVPLRDLSGAGRDGSA